jgi:uncharacterized membrane protein
LPQDVQNVLMHSSRRELLPQTAPKFARTILFASGSVNALDWFCRHLWHRPGFDMLPAMDQAPVLSKSCPHCDSRMPETAGFCPGCGRPMKATVSAQGKVGGLPESVAGAIAYFTFIPAIIFLLVEPYRRNRFVRFHSVQCLLMCAAAAVAAAVLRLASLVLFIIPVLGPLLVVLLDMLAILAFLLIWLVLVVKALQGHALSLPVLGEFADRYADPL